MSYLKSTLAVVLITILTLIYHCLMWVIFYFGEALIVISKKQLGDTMYILLWVFLIPEIFFITILLLNNFTCLILEKLALHSRVIGIYTIVAIVLWGLLNLYSTIRVEEISMLTKIAYFIVAVISTLWMTYELSTNFPKNAKLYN